MKEWIVGWDQFIQILEYEGRYLNFICCITVSENRWRICNQRRHGWSWTVCHSFPESLWISCMDMEFCITLKHDWSILGRPKVNIIFMLAEKKERVCLFDTNKIMVIDKEKLCSHAVCPHWSRKVSSFLSRVLSQSAGWQQYHLGTF